jgi:hypothetical protein
MKNVRRHFATGIVILLALSWLLIGCGPIARQPAPAPTRSVSLSTPTTVPTTVPTKAALATQLHQKIQSVELAILNNIKANGFNPNANINNGLGGLYINWRYGTNPLETNVNGTGVTDESSDAPVRHDDLTDLRYMHNLWSYKAEHPKDGRFDDELKRYTPIIQYEFRDSSNERGWIYDIFMDIYNLSHDHFYKDAALNLVQSYAKAYDPQIGTIYKKNSSKNMLGSYRVDNTLEAGCALIQAGTLTHNADWVQKGKNILQFLYRHAYIARYHTFPAQIGPVLLPSGQLDTRQLFYTGTNKHYTVDGSIVRMGNISQIAISLLDTYKITHESEYLNKAIDLLTPFSLPGNELGMWDNEHGGYFYSLNLSGPSPSDPGTGTVNKDHKEAGRQATMLQAYHLANQLTHSRYQAMEDRMLDVALNHIYVPQIQGSTYEVNADWSFQMFKNDTYNNMATTEAMGAELESLFSLSR